MALKLTLRPDERIVVNGCMMRNSSRRHVLTIESHADVVRGHDLLDEDAPVTPVTRVYYLVQNALIHSKLRDDLVPIIQREMANLATTFGHPSLGHIFEAANYVSVGDYYKAMRALRPVLEHEAKLFDHISSGAKASASMAAE
ncbi:flagellar protein FlbT [Limimaricola soesokkakensis]|uniref:Flagellar biosynthesis repressor FlbT n=1 Tax=Limimaricola soesokkakensis TaxID=1343159 RepID=A0A1X7A7Z2_9RHOB|nr:flagellar biosynthesis repressor FlbT [Limimaricola soesokkakensis]PSK80117.1 flagellar protein FlbT [Limimaricola soesokkakensis]SLN72883.1 flagellar biosynthesis repressor FlbT [Limimaricola soesokkakensis]